VNNTQSAIRLYFYRDKHGNEVDLILDNGSVQTPIEIKLASTFSSSFLRGLDYWMTNFGDVKSESVLIYGGKERFKIKHCDVISWNEIEDILF